MLLRFVEGRPVSQVTEDYLGWLCQRFAAEGKRVFVLVWDNAAWHVSKRVRRWIARHNRRGRREGGGRPPGGGPPGKAPGVEPLGAEGGGGQKGRGAPRPELTGAAIKTR